MLSITKSQSSILRGLYFSRVCELKTLGFIGVLAGIELFYTEQLGEMTAGTDQFTLGMLLELGGGLSWAVFATRVSVIITRIPSSTL